MPVTASEISGKNVPQKTTKHNPTSSRLLTRNTASRDASESIRRSERSASSRVTISATEPASTTMIAPRNHPPTVEAPNAWISRARCTRKVPSSASVNVPTISDTFQVFSMLRRSCTMIECRKAVPVSHGISDAFSTGSHPQ